MEWPLLASLPEPERREFLELARRRRFARQEVVCHAGDPADSLHLIVAGRLSVRVSLPSGDTAMINVLGPGDFWGELALLSPDGHRTATITALEPAETLVVNGAAFQNLRRSRPTVERTLSTLLAHRVDELSQRLLETMYVGLDRRLYRRLLDLCGQYGAAKEPGAAVVIPLTQSQLADLTGGTRPSVNQALQRLVDQGIVALSRGRVEVLDVARLEAKSGL
jgi:CRP-like cAMP-binding protein